MRSLLEYLLPLLMLVGSASGFAPSTAAAAAAAGSSNSRIIHAATTVSTTTSLSVSVAPEQPSNRREVLASLFLVGAANVGQVALIQTLVSQQREQEQEQEQDAMSTPTTTPTTPATPAPTVLSVDEALDVISTSVDRRYLHGVVASDYKLMYRGIPTSTGEEAGASRSGASLVSGGGGGGDMLVGAGGSAAASDFLASLDAEMEGLPVRPRDGLLATTDAGAARRAAAGGVEAASVWPLGEDVHFAWPEARNTFWSKEEDAKSTKVIVDGIDCGRMSLEDALGREGGEIMFRSDGYLAVPVSMEQELLEGLRRAFII